MTQTSLQLPSLQAVHVLVVGDLMLDRYWYGDAARISQEAPVPVVDVRRTLERPGGAANTALNIASMGANCTLLSVVGNDNAHREIRSTLEAAGVTCEFVELEDWSTIVKLRVVSQNQQLIRTDFESALSAEQLATLNPQILAKLEQHMANCGVVVLQDYDKGCVDQPEALIKAAKKHKRPVVVDPKNKPISRYTGAALIKPNAAEFRQAVGAWTDANDLAAKAVGLAKKCKAEAVIVTQGGDGVTVAQATGEHTHIPARAVDVFDVTGAGDTSAAALAITRALNWTPVQCASVANVASSLVVAKSGTAAVTGPELALALAKAPDTGAVDQQQLQELVTQAKLAGQKVVFTNGCFDILHAGHVAYLEEAKALGDRLVVAVNSDASVTELKGEGRPVNPIHRRLQVLAALSAVDWVVDFSEPTPEPLLHSLQPDVLVKGGDYAPNEVVGHEIVLGYGGRVEVLGLVDDCSTSAIVAKIQSE